jgi:hypothetical protein
MTESINQITSLVTEVEEGNVDALKAYIDLMRLNKVIEASLAQIKESAIKEAKNHSKSFEFYGANLI